MMTTTIDPTLTRIGTMFFRAWGRIPAAWRLAAAVLAIGFSPGFPAEAAEAFQWRTATPENQGMSSKKLDDLKDKLSGRTQALLVIRNDRIVYEWYAKDRTAAMPHYTASLAKALVGGMSLAVALTDGQIALDDPVGKFVPAWKKDTKKARITIRHLGSHTSGLEDSSVAGT